MEVINNKARVSVSETKDFTHEDLTGRIKFLGLENVRLSGIIEKIQLELAGVLAEYAEKQEILTEAVAVGLTPTVFPSKVEE